MARNQNKRSVRRIQPARRSVANQKTNPDPIWIAQQHKISHLPQVKGKTLEGLEFISAPDYNGISLSFQDKSCVDLKIETSFTVKAEYLDQKTGRHRLLKSRPRLHRR